MRNRLISLGLALIDSFSYLLASVIINIQPCLTSPLKLSEMLNFRLSYLQIRNIAFLIIITIPVKTGNRDCNYYYLPILNSYLLQKSENLRPHYSKSIENATPL